MLDRERVVDRTGYLKIFERVVDAGFKPLLIVL